MAPLAPPWIRYWGSLFLLKFSCEHQCEYCTTTMEKLESCIEFLTFW